MQHAIDWQTLSTAEIKDLYIPTQQLVQLKVRCICGQWFTATDAIKGMAQSKLALAYQAHLQKRDQGLPPTAPLQA